MEKNVSNGHTKKIEKTELSTKEFERDLKKEEVDLKKEEVIFKKKEVILKKEEGELKRLNVLEKTFELDEWENNKNNNKEFINLSKILYLTNTLTSCSIDEEATVIGSEQKLKSTFNDDEKSTIKTKLFSIINKL